jgi:membrane protein required for colicin V production
MPFQLLDVALIAIMLISALFAAARGFTREVFSLLSWIVAALATYKAVTTPELVAIARDYVADDNLARAVTGGVVFLVVLLVMSYITVRIGDLVEDSVIGTLDRTLGLFYGLVRGLLLVVIAYMFYVWLVPPGQHEPWVSKARTLPLIRATAEVVNGFLPEGIARVISENMRKEAALRGEGQEGGGKAAEPVYERSDKTRLDSLIESQQN